MLSVSDSLTRIDGPGFSGLQLKFLETHFIPDQRLALGKYKGIDCHKLHSFNYC